MAQPHADFPRVDCPGCGQTVVVKANRLIVLHNTATGVECPDSRAMVSQSTYNDAALQLSQQCGLHFEHDRCPGETTLGNRCKCECHHPGWRR